MTCILHCWKYYTTTITAITTIITIIVNDTYIIQDDNEELFTIESTLITNLHRLLILLMIQIISDLNCAKGLGFTNGGDVNDDG